MATQYQISANRENAQSSTGPTTLAGKLTVSKNAMRHGLTATSIDQFPAHIQDQFLDFRQTLAADFNPGSTHETLLFEQYAFAQFLLIRAEAVHVSALEQSLSNPGDNNAFNHLTRVQRYMRGLERSAVQALALLHQSYADRCAAVDVQDLVTHAHNSPVVIPAAAPISRLLQPSSFQATTKDSALRITYVEQSRLSRESRPS
jgi:hypothetical protein